MLRVVSNHAMCDEGVFSRVELGREYGEGRLLRGTKRGKTGLCRKQAGIRTICISICGLERVGQGLWDRDIRSFE